MSSEERTKKWREASVRRRDNEITEVYYSGHPFIPMPLKRKELSDIATVWEITNHRYSFFPEYNSTWEIRPVHHPTKSVNKNLKRKELRINDSTMKALGSK